MFFKDIFRVSIDIHNNDPEIPVKDIERALIQEGQEPAKNIVYFVLKVHFMMNEEVAQGGKFGQAIMGGQQTSSKQGSGGMFDDDGSGLAGLRVARRDIKAKTKDYKIIKRILRTLQNKLK